MQHAHYLAAWAFTKANTSTNSWLFGLARGAINAIIVSHFFSVN